MTTNGAAANSKRKLKKLDRRIKLFCPKSVTGRVAVQQPAGQWRATKSSAQEQSATARSGPNQPAGNSKRKFEIENRIRVFFENKLH